MMAKTTPLYEQHVELGGKMVDFAGWQMPLHYGSQIGEHQFVRQDAGMFDVSHMTIVDVAGEQAYDFLRYVLANDVSKLKERGKALYSCMLNEQGGVLDDLIAYKLAEQRYRLVMNAATHDKDLEWLYQQASRFSVELTECIDLAIVAVQGPQAIAKATQVFSPEYAQAAEKLKPFQGVECDGWLIARTGYTGEEGFEIILPATQAGAFWQQLLAAGVHPCGLGARDTLRLEAGMSLYGSDMDETTTPLESNLAWTVAWEPDDRNFIGRAALLAHKKQGIAHRLVGLVLEEKGVLRNHQKVCVDGVVQGEITSGSFSPTLGCSIAMARVPVEMKGQCMVEMRGKQVAVEVVKLPFVRHGEKVY